MTFYRFLSAMFATAMFTLCVADSAAAAQERHLNVAVFQKKAADFQFDPLIVGSFGTLVSELEQNAMLLFINRAVNVKDRDIINVQSDVLRMTENGKLANGGLDCRFSYNNNSSDDSAFYSVRGMCSLMQANDAGTSKRKIVLKRVMLSEPNGGANLWMLIYEDKESGIAFYADMD